MVRFLVHTICMTYNHEHYIVEAMNGFVIQQTTFPFVSVIIDDASTDGTANMIRQYLTDHFNVEDKDVAYEKVMDYGSVSFARHKTNENCFFAVIFLNENHHQKGKDKFSYYQEWTKTKYAAICEGDDYWTDPLKLQKQVDILEADDSLMAVVTDACVVDRESKQLVPKQNNVVPNSREGRYNIYDFFNQTHHYPTATVCYRWAHMDEVGRMRKQMANPIMGDWIMWICLHVFGDFYYIDEVMSAYRINPTSKTHVVDRVVRAKANWDICEKVRKTLPDQFGDLKKTLADTSWMWEDLAFAYKAKRKYFRMLGCFIMSFVKNPRRLIGELKRKWKNRNDYYGKVIKI